MSDADTRWSGERDEGVVELFFERKPLFYSTCQVAPVSEWIIYRSPNINSSNLTSHVVDIV